MPHDDQLFTPEEVDEQIDWLERASRAQPPTPNTRVIQGLHRLYENEQSDAQSVDAVWQRLLERGALPAQQPQRARRSGPPRLQGQSGPPTRSPAAPARRGLSTRLLAIVAAALLVVVISGLVAGLVLVRQHSPVVSSQPTAKPEQTAQSTQTTTAPEVAYIGSNGDVWVMTVPNDGTPGTPEQWTNQANGGTISYSGLTWSPDGSRLATLRTDNPTSAQPTYTLLVFLPDGTLQQRVSLPGPPYNWPFAWSPDGKQLAYREYTGEFNDKGGIGKLFIFDPGTGTTIKSVTFQMFEGSGCGGGGGWPLINAIGVQHHLGFGGGGVDTFIWSPDQKSLLVGYGCNSGESARVDLATGTTTPGFPKGASYQPGGDLILGTLPPIGNNIGLVDTSGNKVRTLVVNPDMPAYTGDQHYELLVGRAVWSPDGQSVYYEYDDSIWQVNIDGSNAHIVIPGSAIGGQMQVMVQTLGGLSSNSRTLLYLQLMGSADESSTAPVESQWFTFPEDAPHALVLPQGISEAVWRPGS